MKNKMKLVFGLSIIFGSNLFAQEIVQIKNQHYKKHVVRAIDLRETQNKPLYARGAEFTKFLTEALLDGELTAFENDSFNTIVDPVKFKESISLESYFEIEGDPIFDLVEEQESTLYYYNARDLYQLEIGQDWIFDKERSVVNKQNVSLTLFIPADHPDNLRGFQVPIATFKFSDLAKIWKDNPNAIWFNPYNDAAHLNLSNAFQLELYHSYLVKVSNPDDAYNADQFPDKKGIVESLRKEHELSEYESNLWEN